MVEWQTRRTQNAMPRGVPVQVRPRVSLDTFLVKLESSKASTIVVKTTFVDAFFVRKPPFLLGVPFILFLQLKKDLMHREIRCTIGL